jgi:hypothetical protein
VCGGAGSGTCGHGTWKGIYVELRLTLGKCSIETNSWPNGMERQFI